MVVVVVVVEWAIFLSDESLLTMLDVKRQAGGPATGEK